MTHPDSSAFPMNESLTPGLTKREYFAALAMQGYLANPDFGIRLDEAISEEARDPKKERVLRARIISNRAVRHADALIAELSKATGEESK